MRYLFYMITIFILIYYKPYHSFWILIIFFIEYFYFLYYMYIYIQNKKSKKYNIIKIDNYVKGTQSNIFYWFHIQKMNAFLKFYILINKKRINFFSVLFTSFIILFEIPMKIISFIKKFIFNNGIDINNKLNNIYCTTYDNVKNLKIEFLNQIVYLNGYLPRDLFLRLNSIYPNLNYEQFYKMIKLIQYHSNGFTQFENSQYERVQTHLCRIITYEGQKIPFIHPGCYWPITLNRYNFVNKNLTIHASSNVNINLTATQIKGCPINDLIKNNSPAPGTIISCNPEIIKYENFKPISKFQIEAVLFNKKDLLIEQMGWEVEIKNESYFNEKKIVYDDILNSFNTNENIKLDIKNLFIQELMQNNWDIALQILGEEAYLITEIENYFKEISQK